MNIFLAPITGNSSENYIEPVDSITSLSDYKSIITRVELQFRYNYATSKFQNSVILHVPELEADYGIISQRIEAKWLQNIRAALEYATRHLKYYSRPIWKITCRSKELRPQIGDKVYITHPFTPVSEAVITEYEKTEVDYEWILYSPQGEAKYIKVLSILDLTNNISIYQVGEELTGIKVYGKIPLLFNINANFMSISPLKTIGNIGFPISNVSSSVIGVQSPPCNYEGYFSSDYGHVKDINDPQQFLIGITVNVTNGSDSCGYIDFAWSLPDNQSISLMNTYLLNSTPSTTDSVDILLIDNELQPIEITDVIFYTNVSITYGGTRTFNCVPIVNVPA